METSLEIKNKTIMININIDINFIIIFKLIINTVIIYCHHIIINIVITGTTIITTIIGLFVSIINKGTSNQTKNTSQLLVNTHTPSILTLSLYCSP